MTGEGGRRKTNHNPKIIESGYEEEEKRTRSEQT